MGIDVTAGELHGGFGAALEGNIGQLDVTGLLDHARQDLVGVFRLRASHLEIAGCRGLQIVGRGLCLLAFGVGIIKVADRLRACFREANASSGVSAAAHAGLAGAS